MSAAPALRVEGLEVRFPSRTKGRDLEVLDRLDLAVAPGELVAVIGPSGCGKTTLLHVVQGLLAPVEGSVESGGRTALVFQRPTLLPWRAVLANATYGLECAGRDPGEATAAAAALLERLGLGDHLRDYPHALSEGLKQRVNLARALLVEPDLLLLDEPFAALDARTRRRLQDDLLALWERRGCAILLVSHTIEEVVYLADRVVVLSDKPTRVAADVPVELPRPRDPADPATGALVRRLEELLGLRGQPSRTTRS